MRMDLSAQHLPAQKLTKKDGVNAGLSERSKFLMKFFTVEFKVGSEETQVRVLIDFSLNVLFFPIHPCDPIFYNYENDTCHNNSLVDLSSFKNTSEPFLWFQGGGSLSGYYASDIVTLGDFSGEVIFGACTDIFGNFGLGLEGSPYLEPSLSTNVTFLEQLVEKGIISSNSYSIQLCLNNALNGSLILGALDHNRYKGELQKVRMVKAFTNDSYQDILIILDGILGHGFYLPGNFPASLSGHWEMLALPSNIVKRIAKYMRAVFDNYYEAHIVDCGLLNLTDLISLYFSGIEIEVPIRDLVMQSRLFCYLSFRVAFGPPHIGQDVLKNAYVVVDLDSKEVALAQAAVADSENIEDIVSGIPLALKAPLYSYTEVAVKYSSDTSQQWHTKQFKVPSPSHYSINTGRRSADLGGTVYTLEFPWATASSQPSQHPRSSSLKVVGSSSTYLSFVILLLLVFLVV